MTSVLNSEVSVSLMVCGLSAALDTSVPFSWKTLSSGLRTLDSAALLHRLLSPHFPHSVLGSLFQLCSLLTELIQLQARLKILSMF